MAVDAFAGIDVAFAKGKRLPIVVCKREGARLIPLMLRGFREALPPRGRGNRVALDPKPVRDFVVETLAYLRVVERTYDLRLRRIAIDAPSCFKREGLARRAAELAMDRRRISCFATPSRIEFDAIRATAATHLRNGGAENRMPLSGVNYFFSSATIRIPVPLGQVKPLGATEKLVRGQI